MTYKWTFMVYMAGDNGKLFDDGERLMANLESYGWRNIADMAQVGSSAQVAVVVQYDTMDAGKTPRFFVDGSSEMGQVVGKLPPINTGDPRNLTDFIVWAETCYPAERYALVLWNHGSGWKEDDIYARYRELEMMKQRDQVRGYEPGKKLLRRALFLPTAAEIMGIQDDEVRAICYDDTSMDYLDNQKLVQALTDAEEATGQRLAVLGMDACLMSMIEVAYQVRDHAGIMVASQEVEPGTGWPYTAILRQLVDTPSMSARELGEFVVQAYGEYYLARSREGGGSITQSAVDLDQVGVTAGLVASMAQTLSSAYSQDLYVEMAVRRAKDYVQRFRDRDYVDLYHLAEQLWLERPKGRRLVAAGDCLKAALQIVSSNAPVVANVHGPGRPNAHGLSIYFPQVGCSAYYDRLDFAALGWRDWLHLINKPTG